MTIMMLTSEDASLMLITVGMYLLVIGGGLVGMALLAWFADWAQDHWDRDGQS